MSIATLKKKTKAQYNNSSVGFAQFSLNGTLRNQGYVGQTTLSRSLPKTPMKGNVICGHGGCCGTYAVQPIVQSAVTSLNDPTIVKSSVLSTNGMIHTKYRWINRPQPYTVVKPDTNAHYTQQDRITYIAKKTIQDINQCNTVKPLLTNGNPNYNAYLRSNTCSFTKPASMLSAISQGEKIIQLHNHCIDPVEKEQFYIPSNTNHTPFACNNLSPKDIRFKAEDERSFSEILPNCLLSVKCVIFLLKSFNWQVPIDIISSS